MHQRVVVPVSSNNIHVEIGECWRDVNIGLIKTQIEVFRIFKEFNLVVFLQDAMLTSCWDC